MIEHWKNLSLEPICEEHEGVLYVEEWRPVINYKDKYEVSSFGRIKSLERLAKHYAGGVLKKKSKILRQGLDQDGYLQVLLCKDGKSKCFKVHKLVANAFIENIENKPTVNHRFGKKADNRVHQLEWFTVAEQTKHSYDVLNRALSPSVLKSGKDNPKSKKVVQFDLNDNYISSYNGTREAQRSTGINRSSIGAVCRGAYKTAGGFKWKYI